MGLLALGILWVNTGLVLAVALRQLQNLMALRGRLAEATRRGALVSGRARASDRFAVRRITMIGRAITTKGPDRILFTDGPQSFEVLGGEIETEKGTIEIEATPPAASEVWTDASREREGTACASAAEFSRAFSDASTFKGFSRDAEIEIKDGDRVWVYGVREENRITASEEQPLVVSAIDPIAFCSSRMRLIALFIGASAIVLGAITALAVWPPHFGLLSTIGGALGLAYFLAIQPLGTAVRDAVKTPARRLVGATWQRPAPEAATA